MNSPQASWFPDPAHKPRAKDNLVITDFATMERGEAACLIIKAEPGMQPPVSARWLASALELTFQHPPARTMLFVAPKFRSKWVNSVVVALFDGPGDIVKGRITINDMVPVPIAQGH